MKTVRMVFFGAMSILDWLFSYFPFALFGLGGVVGLVSFIGWIVLQEMTAGDEDRRQSALSPKQRSQVAWRGQKDGQGADIAQHVV